MSSPIHVLCALTKSVYSAGRRNVICNVFYMHLTDSVVQEQRILVSFLFGASSFLKVAF